jgi:patatin-related protein
MSSVSPGAADELEQSRGAVTATDISVSDMTQDLRLAIAMSGGVSLAVWMGGVAREVNLLQQASNRRSEKNCTSPSRQASDADGVAPSHNELSGNDARDWDARSRELYMKLLRLLDLKVTVDVLSGTSAGGINAALLGLSSAAEVDLAGLRDLWLTTGSMDLLLRDPAEKDPPSLMQGDKVLFTGLAEGIRDLYDRGHRHAGHSHPDPEVDTTVFITTTMMSGETSRFTDDYGTLVPDVDHHGLFTFGQDALAPESGRPRLAELALAARSSASFPGAFEPSFVPIGHSIAGTAGMPAHPDMARFANMTRSHWTADGGLLANRPLTPLLARIMAQPARGQVRRVLAFVVPDGGGTPSPAAQSGADQWGQPPTLAGALRQDLDAQLAQSITSDLQAIRAHNEKITARHNTRRYLAEIGSKLSGDSGLVNGELLRQYQRQQGAGLAQPLTEEVMRQLTTMPLPETWAAELSPGGPADGGATEDQMARAMARILGGGWKAPDPAAGQSPETEEAGAWGAWTAAADPFSKAAMFGLPVFNAAKSTAVHLTRLGYQRAASPFEREKITGHRAAIEDAGIARAAPWDEYRQVAEQLTEAAQASPVLSLPQVAARLADAKRRALLIGQPPAAPNDLENSWKRLVDAMIPLLRDLELPSAADGRDFRDEAAGAISSYLRYFGDTPTADTVADRLLSLVIAERALQRAEPEVDQPVEFIQVSANTRTLLAAGDSASALPPLDTVDKLRGVELHHFAAFCKSSWRAYDWMWGRMDGCGWLVHILLDPRRILSVIEDRYQWPHGKRAANFARLLRQTAGISGRLEGDCLEEDLRYLDEPGAGIPASLPDSAVFLAQAWQNLITASELPVIAQQMLAGDAHQDQPISRPARAWAANVFSMQARDMAPADFAKELPRCPVRTETLATQVHTPAFARIAAKAAAVATAAIAAAPQVPGPLRRVLGAARTVTRTGYLAANATGGSGAKTMMAGLVLALIGGVLATQGLIVIGITGTAVALAGLYLIALGAWGIHRGLLGALVAITILALIGSLTLPWVRQELWGTGQASTGMVPRDVLPWLRSTWWGGLTIVGGTILLAALLSVFTHRRPRRNRGGLVTVANAQQGRQHQLPCNRLDRAVNGRIKRVPASPEAHREALNEAPTSAQTAP